MPILINQSTGLAEDLPQEHADTALQGGSHALPLNDPEGNPVTAPLSEAQGLIAQGYSQPHPEQLQHLLDYNKYTQPAEQVKAALEGAGRGATFGASSFLEQALGVNKKDIAKREEFNPGSATTGEIGGLALSSFIPGIGEAGLLSKAGHAAADLAGIEGTALLAKAAQGAIKAATETAILQGGNEVHKLAIQDPDQSLETALLDIGLSGALGGLGGGAFSGVVAPLWEKANGSKLGQLLSQLRAKAMGAESSGMASEAARAAGVELAPEVNAAIGGEEAAKGAARDLIDSGTKYGEQFRAKIDQARQDIDKAALSAMGHTPESALADRSAFEAGESVKKSLTSELKAKIDPVSAQFDPISERFKNTELPDRFKNYLAEKMGKLAVDEGLTLSESSPGLAEVNRVIKDSSNLKTLEDLRKYQSVARKNLSAMGDYRLAGQVANVLRDVENDALSSRLATEAPHLAAQLSEAREGYKGVMNLADSLNERLHVGKYGGPSSFIKAIGEMSPEQLLQRMSNKKDAGLLALVKEQFPQTADILKKHIVDGLIDQSSRMGKFNVNTLLKRVEELSPEMRQFALPGGAEEQLKNVGKLLESLPTRQNFSNTARTLDHIWNKIPGGIGSMISLLTGHNPLFGYIAGQAGRLLGREVPDYLKFSMLRFLGSEATEASATGFKAMHDMVASATRGQQLVNKGVKSILKGSAEVIPEHLIPTPKMQATVEKRLEQASISPDQLMQATGRLGEYMPGHAEALGSTVARASSYLQSLRPKTAPDSVFGSTRTPNSTELAQYNRAVGLVASPLSILQHVKNGTITAQDMTTMQTVYPNLLKGIQAKVLEHVSGAKDKGTVVPYKTRLGLSLLLNTPLEASIMPQNMLANAPKGNPPPNPQQSIVGHSKGTPQALKKLPQMAQTSAQAGEARRITR